MTCWVGSSRSSYYLLSLWALCLVKVKMKYFWFVTWPLDWSVKWLSGWGPFILSHHPARFGIHRSWESGDTTSLICHVTKCLICQVTCGWGPLILSHHPTKFGVRRPCESGNITPLICHVTTWLCITWLCRWGPLILSHHPAKFGIHMPYGTGNNNVCNISSNSNYISNSNAEIYKWFQ